MEFVSLCLSALILGIAIGILVSVSAINSKNQIQVDIKLPDNFKMQFSPLSLNAHINNTGAVKYSQNSAPVFPPHEDIKINTEAFIPVKIEDVKTSNLKTESRSTELADDVSSIASKLRDKKEKLPRKTLDMMSNG